MHTHPIATADWVGKSRSAWARLTAPEWLSWPVLTAGEQTRLSWARVVESYELLPAVSRDPFSALFSGVVQPFPYTVLAPSREGFLNRLNPQLISIHRDTIYVLEKTGSRVGSTCYALAGITHLEIGTILLKSWITLRGARPHSVGPERIRRRRFPGVLYRP